jgi:lysyl-tRNA synthetase class 2
MLLRRQGKLVFADLRDSSGSVQLFVSAASAVDFDAFSDLSLGDWIGVAGELITTKRGELSVDVEKWSVLARTRRGFGDKWHGVTDPETRYRQRYVDLWANPEARRVFQLRSAALACIRRSLQERGFMEVETPLLQTIPTGAMAKPFVTHHNALDMDLYLRIAPELFLKRLIVGGFERVFEIGRVFRNEGISPRHNPEFTMLELYQAYADYSDIMSLTEELVSAVAQEVTGSMVVEYQGVALDFRPPWRRATLEDLVSEQVGEEVSLEMEPGRLDRLMERFGIEAHDAWGPGKKVAELYEATTESTLIQPTFVCDFPVEISPLARDHRSKVGRVERFEAFVAGRELANAFSELNDPVEQRRRFQDQGKARTDGDEEAMVLDEDYLRALDYGLPPTGGLGIGLDRLVMVLTNATHIREVVLFPTLRQEIFDSSL